jgi:hypothetical protein
MSKPAENSSHLCDIQVKSCVSEQKQVSIKPFPPTCDLHTHTHTHTHTHPRTHFHKHISQFAQTGNKVSSLLFTTLLREIV